MQSWCCSVFVWIILFIVDKKDLLNQFYLNFLTVDFKFYILL